MKWIKKSNEFQDIYQKSNKIVGRFFILLYKPNHTGLEAGIVVSKKVGKAVIRNKIKRRIRAYLHVQNQRSNKNVKMIIVARKQAAEMSWNECKQDLNSLFSNLSVYEISE
jgi:ribonuclease P protein component